MDVSLLGGGDHEGPGPQVGPVPEVAGPQVGPGGHTLAPLAGKYNIFTFVSTKVQKQYISVFPYTQRKYTGDTHQENYLSFELQENCLGLNSKQVLNLKNFDEL